MLHKIESEEHRTSPSPTIVYFLGGKKTIDLQHNQTKKGRAIADPVFEYHFIYDYLIV